MTPADIRAALEQAAPGSRVDLPIGEFEGPFMIARPITVGGHGLKTVLWCRRGPVVTIRGAGVGLEDLVIDVTEERNGVSLAVESEVPPTLTRVRLVGRSRGWPSGHEWFVPPVLDFARVVPSGKVERTLTMETPWPVTVSAELDGLTLLAAPGSTGRCDLTLELDAMGFAAGSFIEGRIVVSGGGVESLIRVTGVLSPNRGPSQGSASDAWETERDSDAEVLGRAFAAAESTRGESNSTGATRKPRRVADPVSPGGGASPKDRAAEPGETAERLQTAARAARDAGDLDRAKEVLGRAVLLEPHSCDVHGELAAVLEKRGEIGAARGEWGAVLAIDPSYPGALSRLARCCNLLGRYDETVAILEQHLADAEDFGAADLMSALAVAYHSLGRNDEALWAVDKSLEVRADPRLLALRRVWERS